MKLRVFFCALTFCYGVNAQTIVETTNTNNNTNNDTVTQTTTSTSKTTSDQTIRSAPPTAVAPAMMSIGGNDICVTGISGAVQTQILGISAGKTVRDMNCERLKLSKTLFDMGMKVAAVSALCQDERVFDAMMDAGTPCPKDGKIGAQAKALWELEKENAPKKKELIDEDTKTYGIGIGAMLALLLAL